MRIVQAKIAKPTPLPQFLRQSFPYMPQKILANALDKRDIKRDGVRLNRQAMVQPGDELQLFIADQYLDGSGSIDIVYEDEKLVIVNKRAGQSVVEDANGAPSLLELLCASRKQVFPCHRLDHNTGGLCVFAKELGVKAAMEQAFKERSIEKYYRCLVFGKPRPGEGLLKGYLKKDAKEARVYISDAPAKGALPIETAYRVLDTCETVSLLYVQLLTGRTHQIRAHLAHIGHHICGDDKYGNRQLNKDFSVGRQQLWATELVFHFANGPLKYLDGKHFRVSPSFTMRGFESGRM